MVNGLEAFRDAFQEYKGQYVLIGGAACDLILSDIGVQARATKDLDIVLCMETLTKEFMATFWEFIQQGAYQLRAKANGKHCLYRFQSPQVTGYPSILELFSRRPDWLNGIADEAAFIPIPDAEQHNSLSAILLDDDYYALIRDGMIEMEGVPLVRALHLIPLKAKAYLDLSDRKDRGEQVDAKDIAKHRNDIFRLYNALVPDETLILPLSLHDTMRKFLSSVRRQPLRMKDYGIARRTQQEVIEQLEQAYQISVPFVAELPDVSFQG